jgi:hypothetical protein
VLYLEPGSEPYVLLPEAAAGEQVDDYLLPARFSVSVPRDGHFVFTPPAGVERLRVVLTEEPMPLQQVVRLPAWSIPRVNSVEDVGRAANNNGGRHQAFVLSEADHRQRVVAPPKTPTDTIVLEVELQHN